MRQWLSLVNAGRLATRRRRHGVYDSETYALYERWAGLGLKARVEWCKYSLEYLGRLPDNGALNAGRVESLCGRRLLFDMLNCLLAVGQEPVLGERVRGFCDSKVSALATHSPAIAAWLLRHDVDLPDNGRGLAIIDQRQQAWRSSFVRDVLKSGHNICVVGNAAGLEGRGLASAIDSHDFVFRFNHFLPRDAGARIGLQADIGSRLTGWVVASDLAPPFNGVEHAEWLFLSGPDIRYRLFHWSKWLPFLERGVPVITFPLSTWSNLVQKLKAPPSAGLLFLAWLLENSISAIPLSIAGFQLEQVADRYHLVLKEHKAVNRHNWNAERCLIRQWIAQGRLKCL